MNEVGSLLNAGLSGIENGLKNAQKSAEEIVQSTVGVGEKDKPATDLAEAAVNLKASELQVKASAKVIQVADETLGTLIDTLA